MAWTPENSTATNVDELLTEWAAEASLGAGLLEAPVFWGLVEKYGGLYRIHYTLAEAQEAAGQESLFKEQGES